jgi:branched-chain amino acid transport system permease protein
MSTLTASLPTLDWRTFVQLCVNSLQLGSVYALLALGYSMVYGVLKLLNFAHGDVFMIGAYIGYGVLVAFGGASNPSIAVWLLIVLMVLAGMIGCGGLGVLVERVAYRPLRAAPRIAPLISALGVSFFLQNSAQLLFGAAYKPYNTINLIDVGSGIHWGNLNVWTVQLIVIGAAFAMMVLLTYLVQRTRVGKAMRAVSVDREAAAMMGIDPDRVIVFTFFVGSALAGAAGVLIGLVLFQAFPSMGFTYGLAAFTAAVVGGIGYIPGAMFGGLLIGFVQAFSQFFFSTWFNLVSLAILVLVMLLRPSGLFGKATLQKV